MQVDIQELLDSAGVKETLYPGKKLVRRYPQGGEYKSHCAVFDWHEPALLHVEIKAGLTGKTMDGKDLRHYPVSFQAPTYLDIDMREGQEDEDETEGKSGGGGKQPQKKKPNEKGHSFRAFSKANDGNIPTAGDIVAFVVMGKELAAEAFTQAYENLKEQLSQTKIMAMDLMKGVSEIIKKATPGGGLSARGDETVVYQYDSEKTAPMFGGPTPG